MKLVKLDRPTRIVYELTVEAGQHLFPNGIAASIVGRGEGEYLDLSSLKKQELIDLISNEEGLRW